MRGHESPERDAVSRRRALAAIGTAAVVGVAGCAGGGASAQDDYDVGMTAVAFDPVEITVSAGDTVVWANTSSRGHTVTAYDSGIPEDATFFASGGYDSTAAARDAYGSELGGLIESGASWSHTFEVPGEYEYFCIPHEASGMVGTVVVEE
ncbi:plastocyanin/azurin family copper-binding protein [Halobellus ruber]|uniref:Halocyanin n=1 Tax=Halobellus ruber TaxID=2761102 RepID=A0A7J9SHU3_9EURY|nr:plastocyanin/azurin family copper-binding protein [Halobellus ruber]MBB6645933.1 halocyanin [Halobellus ruber]